MYQNDFIYYMLLKINLQKKCIQISGEKLNLREATSKQKIRKQKAKFSYKQTYNQS